MIIDMEMQQPLINGPSKPSKNWNEIEVILKEDNAKKLESSLQEYKDNPLGFLRPINAPSRQTILHGAITSGAQDCLRALLKSSYINSIIDAPNVDGMTALHIAAKEGKFDAVKDLLNSSAHINARNNFGNTPLHILSEQISFSATEQSSIIQCLDILLDAKDVDLEAHNNLFLTPLLLAANAMSSEGHAKIDSVVLTFCRRLVSKGASLDAKDCTNVTVEEVLTAKGAKTSVLMCNRQPPPSRPTISLIFDTLILGGDISVNKFRHHIKDIANMWLGSSTVLAYAISRTNFNAVKIFLEAGANPNYKDDKGNILSFHKAIATGHVDILTLLLHYMKENANGSPLDFRSKSFEILCSLIENHRSSKTSKALDKNIDHMACLRMILRDDLEINVNQVDSKGNRRTALHKAASLNNQEAIEMLLVAGANLGMRHVIHGKDYGNILPAMRQKTLTDSMDGCIKYNPRENEEENIMDPNYSLKIDYNFLIPQKYNNDDIPNCESETLMDIKKNKQHRRSITHPLIQVLLFVKWRKVLPLFLFNLFMYFIFVVILTGFMYSLKDLRILENRKENNISGYDLTGKLTIDEEIQYYNNLVNGFMVFLLPLTIYLLIREIFQMVFTRSAYLKNIENYIEVFLIVLVFVLSVARIDVEMTRHLAAWAIIVAG